MHKIVSVLTVLALVVTITGCGHKKVINGEEYDTYGLINADRKKELTTEQKTSFLPFEYDYPSTFSIL